MDIEIDRQPGFVLLRIRGDLRLWNHAEEEEKVLSAFGAALETPPPQVVLSIREVTHVDTRGIWTLVQLIIRCSKRNIGLKVVMPGGIPGQALRSIGVFEAWPKFDEEAAALRAAGA